MINVSLTTPETVARMLIVTMLVDEHEDHDKKRGTYCDDH